jgi:hypothetical protein
MFRATMYLYFAQPFGIFKAFEFLKAAANRSESDMKHTQRIDQGNGLYYSTAFCAALDDSAILILTVTLVWSVVVLFF